MQKFKMKKLVDIEMSRNTQDAVNLIANILSFGVSLVISFFISPYIVKNLGAEANGFVTLANNFINYATVIKTALNSIGSRCIILAYHQGDYEKANKYYSSLFWGDLILSILFSILSIICIWKLENLINISADLVRDVKILFSLIFLNFILSTAATIFSSAPYIKNKIFLQSIRDIQCSVARAIILIILFSLFKPKIFFLGIAALVPGIILNIYNIYYKIKLVPELKVSKKKFSIKIIKELVSQGIWNSVNSVGLMLLTSLDLLIANLYIGEKDMGILSVAKSMPNVISGMGDTMASAFFASMMIDFAHNDIKQLTKTVKQSTMMIASITTIPLAFLIGFGTEFYSLWQPTLDAKQLQILSFLTCMGYILYAGTNSVSTIFTVTLHIKERSLSVLISGVISFIITLALVKYTQLGIYAIAAVSSVVTIIRVLFYVVPQGGKYLGLSKTTFLPVSLKSVTSTIVLVIIAYIIKMFIPNNSWVTLIISALIFSLISVAANMFIIMDKNTRSVFVNMLKSKLLKVKKKKYE